MVIPRAVLVPRAVAVPFSSIHHSLPHITTSETYTFHPSHGRYLDKKIVLRIYLLAKIVLCS
jgi:hypothetical protein